MFYISFNSEIVQRNHHNGEVFLTIFTLYRGAERNPGKKNPYCSKSSPTTKYMLFNILAIHFLPSLFSIFFFSREFLP